jgi:hypothetical protein
MPEIVLPVDWDFIPSILEYLKAGSRENHFSTNSLGSLFVPLNLVTMSLTFIGCIINAKSIFDQPS